MSVTSVTLGAGTLSVIADGAADDIEIRQQIPKVGTAVGTTVKVTDKTAAANNVWSFNASAVQRILVQTNGGNDRVVSNAAAPVRVFAGDGNDQITTGGGGDQIDVGAGNDTVSAGGGNDVVFGQAGDDFLAGGA